MQKERRDDSFIKKPIYPGGNAAYRKFIKDNLKYPKEAADNKVEGTVHLKYSIDHKGDVIDTKVVKSIGYGCDEEAIRLVKLLKFEIPKGPRKLRVTFHKKTQITFRAPKVKAKPKQKSVSSSKTQIVYQYKQSQKTNQEVKPKSTYGYTITFNG